MNPSTAKAVGAFLVPDPRSINPASRIVNCHILGVLNPGLYHQGDVLVVSSQKVYDELRAEGWEETSIPEEYK